jgi:cytochrome bd-type quinol oxidase subunit 2
MGAVNLGGKNIMLKKLFTKSASVKKSVSALMMALVVMAMSALPAFAANPDLDTVTGDLVTGAGDMKTNAMLVIGICITIFIVIFGIGWLMSIFKKKMSKAG